MKDFKSNFGDFKNNFGGIEILTPARGNFIESSSLNMSCPKEVLPPEPVWEICARRGGHHERHVGQEVNKLLISDEIRKNKLFEKVPPGAMQKVLLTPLRWARHGLQACTTLLERFTSAQLGMHTLMLCRNERAQCRRCTL